MIWFICTREWLDLSTYGNHPRVWDFGAQANRPCIESNVKLVWRRRNLCTHYHQFKRNALSMSGTVLVIHQPSIALAPFLPFYCGFERGVVSGRFGVLACLVPCFRSMSGFWGTLGVFGLHMWLTQLKRTSYILANWWETFTLLLCRLARL